MQRVGNFTADFIYDKKRKHSSLIKNTGEKSLHVHIKEAKACVPKPTKHIFCLFLPFTYQETESTLTDS